MMSEDKRCQKSFLMATIIDPWIGTDSVCFVYRRYVVLTKDYLYTFAEQGKYSAPTEAIKMESCCTVKSSDDEVNKESTFVSIERGADVFANFDSMCLETGTRSDNILLPGG